MGVRLNNYRNTREIPAFALSAVEGDKVVDLEGDQGRADAPLDVDRRELYVGMTRARDGL